MKKYLKTSLKIFLWIIGSLIVFFLIIVIIIQIPAVQNFAKDKAVTYLEGKIKTKVTVQNIDIEFPKKVVLDGVYFEDQQSDTILIAKKMAVDISLFKILNNIIEINSINLQDATAKILRDKNEKYNFDYIIQAFVNPKKPKDNSPPMEFSIDKINLDNVNFYFNDAISGNNISVKLTHFDTRIKKFDLNKMEFEIPKAKLAGLKLKLKQGIGIVQSETTSKKSLPEKDLKIKLGDLDLSKIDFYYYNENSKLTNTILLQKLFISFDEIDLKKEFIAIKNIQLTDTNGNLELGELKEIISQTDLATTPTSNNWKVKITQANFKKINFKFDDFNSLPTDKKLDYRHLDIKNLNLNAEKISYAIQKTSGKINSFTVKEKSGLDIQSLKTDFIYTNNKGVSLKNLYLKTPQTSLKDEIIISYPSVSILQENIGELGIIAHLQNSKLGFKDVLLFVPTLEKTSPFDKNPNAVLNINSKISGKLKNITFPNLEISGIGNTKIAASGRIIGLPDFKKAYFDLAIKKLQSNSKDIYSFVPLGTIPNTIAIPNLFEVRGFFRGTYDNFNTNLNLVSSFGDAKIKAVFDQRQKDKEKYDAKAELDNFDVGKLIKDKTVGKITAKATIKGVGLNPKTANALVEGAIQKAVFNNYTYQNLKLKGNIN